MRERGENLAIAAPEQNMSLLGAVSALTLLVTKVRAKHANDAIPANNLAVTANFLDGSTNFHGAISTTGCPAYSVMG